MAASAIARFRKFADSCANQGELAKLIGCSQPILSKILSGKRGVGIDLAAGIEQATANWKGGQIKATEWRGYKPENARAA